MTMMRTEKEVDQVLKQIDEEMQKQTGNLDLPIEVFRGAAVIRTTLLWVKGELDNIN